MFGALRKSLRGLVQRRRVARELDDELRFHLEMEIEENRRAGMTPAEARRVALRDFGGLEQTKEAVRDVRTLWLDSVCQDVHLTLRMLRRSPGFVAVSLLSLALGLGVNVAVFTFVDALFLRPLPGVRDPSRLVCLELHTRATGRSTGASYRDVQAYRQRAHSFSDVLAFARFPMTVRAGDVANSVPGELVSGTYFPVLGLTPAAGRLLDAQDDKPGAEPAAVLSDEAWRRWFGNDPRAIGRGIKVGSMTATIVGVAPRGFHGLVLDGPEPPALWVPVSLYQRAVPAMADANLFDNWGAQSFDVFARLAPGVSHREAVAEMTVVAPQVDRERVAGWSGDLSQYAKLAVELVPAMRAQVSPEDRGEVTAFLSLLGAVSALIFLVACFNVANLILARATRRRHELAVRVSLGAGRMRLVRQLLTENVTLAALGAAVAVPVAHWTSQVLVRFGEASPLSLVVEPGLHFDGRLMVYVLALIVLTGVLLTLLPARLASRAGINADLGGRSGRTATGLRTHHVLVAAQVALSIVLLVGAGLFLRTLRNALAVDVTLRPDRVLLAQVDPGAAGYDPERAGRLYAQLLDRVRALPGVIGAAQVFVVPLGGRRGGTDIELPARTGGRSQTVQVGFNVVSTEYFRTVGLPLLAGRGFVDADRAGAPPVAVINQTMADRLLAGRNPIGERLLLKGAHDQMVEVVGVVRDGKFRNYRADSEPTVYVPLAQRYVSPVDLEVRVAGAPLALVPAIRRQLAALDPNLPLTAVETAQAHFDTALWQERLTATLLSGLGLLALVLAATGIYGVLSYVVAQRTWEIGVRLALGARPRQIFSMVLGQVIGLVTLGAATGLVAAWQLVRLVRGLLYRVSPTDPLVLSASALGILAVALVAGFLPARRAASVDPAAALRAE